MPRLLKIALLIASFAAFSHSICAQTEGSEEAKQEIVKEEKIDTVWQFTKYLGSKLGKELKTRLNLDEEKGEKETVKVSINIGRYKVERLEQRPSKES